MHGLPACLLGGGGCAGESVFNDAVAIVLFEVFGRVSLKMAT
eukprot:COSAG01_NODE_1157_length_11476_cov_87.701503_12_plen_42_part_00